MQEHRFLQDPHIQTNTILHFFKPPPIFHNEHKVGQCVAAQERLKRLAMHTQHL